MNYKLSKPSLSTNEIFSDRRGSLIAFEKNFGLSFELTRAYLIFDFNNESLRGAHAHPNLSQVLTLIHGEVNVKLKTPYESIDFSLKSINQSLHVPPGWWREITSLSNQTMLLVLADKKYEDTVYIRNEKDYKVWFDHNVLG